MTFMKAAEDLQGASSRSRLYLVDAWRMHKSKCVGGQMAVIVPRVGVKYRVGT